MWKTFLMSCIMMLSVSGVALAHFGMVIPSAGTVTDKKDADVTLDLSFTHPMEMQGMPLAKPKAVQVIANGKTEDLKPSLKAKKIVDHDGWTGAVCDQAPGVYQFVMEPQPYWGARPRIATSSITPRRMWRRSVTRKAGMNPPGSRRKSFP